MSESSVPRSEYEQRWRKAQEAARERGLDGLVVWSRGGATVDSYADVLYLSNHYSQFPLVNDMVPHWAGRSHSALVIPLDREPTLVVDIPDWRRDLVAVDDVRFSLDLPGTVAAVVLELALGKSRLGLVGGNAMLVSPYRLLLSALRSAELDPADDLVEALRVHKSPRELELISRHVKIPLAVAGGITPSDLPKIMAYRPAVVIVGRYILRARDPALAAREVKDGLAELAKG